MEREVTLIEMLEAREARVNHQEVLLSRFGVPVVSFSMNIAGPIKNSALIRRAFRAGCAALDAAFSAQKLHVLSRERQIGVTGCEAMYSVEGELMQVKQICTQIEDASSLGRLFDMDVIGPCGAKVDREAVGGGPRNCIVCGAPGRGCASRRVHSVAELQEATKRILTDHFRGEDRQTIARLATQCLVDEVRTTPKPGLVDEANNGSHRDMNLSTFLKSAEALRPYWGRCVEIGMCTAMEAPEETFAALRCAGLDAEQAMYAATGGVNTHKGVIYTLGILCGALGRLWQAERPFAGVAAMLAECARMTKASVDADFAAVRAAGFAQANTAGQRFYLNYGLRGIRGEVADGLPGVACVALPAFQKAMQDGYSRNDAGVIALLHLIVNVTDTNMIARGGMEEAKAAAKQVQHLLDADWQDLKKDVETLDRAFIQKNLSPGGSADLLAITYFCDALESTFSTTEE